MTRRRTKTKRTNKRRNKGTGAISLPNRNHETQGQQKANQLLRDIHEMRTKQAQITDEALTATLAPTPEHWIKHPEKYDIKGIDYPENKQQTKPTLQKLRKLHTDAIPEKPKTDPRTGKQPKEHWLPSTLKTELIKEWQRPEEEKTGIALIKYFTPDANAKHNQSNSPSPTLKQQY